MFARLTGWPPPALLVTVSITSGTRSADSAEQRFEPLEVDVALERIQLVGRVRLGSHEVHGLGAGRLDVAARRVEVRVGRNDPARPADDREQDRLGRAALVRRE